MKLQPTGAIALSLGAATVFSALTTTQSSAAPKGNRRPATAAVIATTVPGTTATPAATTVPGTTATPAATACPTRVPGSSTGHTSGSRDIRLLEGALARTLTATELAAIAASATTRDTAVQAAVTAFEAQVAAIFDLTVAELQAKIKSSRRGRNSDLASVLATALGRALTADETISLNGALATRDAAITEATDAYRTSVAAAVGLSLADLDAKVAAYLAANNGIGSGGGGGRGGGGRGGGRGR